MTTPIYIGVAWPYAYAPFHVGNLYGSHLPADIFSRFHKLLGHRVMMVSGSDCHGTPITLAAEKEGVSPEEVASKYHQINTHLLERLSIAYTNWTTTTTTNHKQVVQQQFLQLLEQGYIVSKVTKQLFSPSEGKFLQDRYIEGTCPFCGSDKARGDQCEQCGRLIDPLELKHPRSKNSGEALEVKETENFMIDLEALQPQLETYLKGREGVMRDWVLRETNGWLKEGLRARAITRDMSYGIALPVEHIPEEKRIKNIDQKVFYVWFEAVIGYLSAAIEADPEGYTHYWKNDDAEHYYFVGEDNLVFHTINWPSQLLGTGQGYHLPTNVFVNKFLMLESKKISKSANWIVDTEAMLDAYPLDSIRFYLGYIMTGDDQTNFQWEDFYHVNNGVFLAKIGNLANRVLSFSVKQFGRDIAATSVELDLEILDAIKAAFEKTSRAYAESKVREALLAVCELAERGNDYLTKHEFWKLVKEDKEACRKVVLSALELINAMRVMLAPVTPDFAQSLHQQLGYSEKLSFEEGQDQWQYMPFASDQLLAEDIAPLVTKFEESMIEEEKSKLG